MKIVNAFLLLGLASVFVGLNVSAADQSICQPGTNVTLYADGMVKACQLQKEYDANSIKCKSNSPISFYSKGDLESCVLATAATIDATKCKENGPVSFYLDGKLKSCVKPDN
jgi:hypothetical protein